MDYNYPYNNSHKVELENAFMRAPLTLDLRLGLELRVLSSGS